ncbi:hypothetical protein EYF80_000608 [Liparis tanakae]|uniref:Uncharacterized protein n=1 Tax=Liparis tanakae TaxID=230148 RepID=A0A4Z2JGP3_9TELE|nr:hypothetical protein EYF80_000608 [Liparis tanakae]
MDGGMISLVHQQQEEEEEEEEEKEEEEEEAVSSTDTKPYSSLSNEIGWFTMPRHSVTATTPVYCSRGVSPQICRNYHPHPSFSSLQSSLTLDCDQDSIISQQLISLLLEN